ncbi:MAG: hypothetical protein ABJO29_01365 [Yoonia sp.]|uniref:hypothetical protein n=1 Tax=Rhodobacterales TaxID=204455 RepID=UPI001FF6B4C9|nr:hypothetical protein [Loktanella sp. F6476L]MCK0121093.1 hypothetical protein [Loktanella sp. F6476L]UWQ99903.1 hypothetical protein K3729_03675 [Rhodobacteraceae bacterium S2214]
MRAALFIVPLLLTACATPREACLDEVNREVRVLDALIAETRANLSRGFAVEERQDVRTRRANCVGKNEDGTKFSFRCDKTETRTRTVPIAIDLNAERAKLTSLEQRQMQNISNAQAGIAQCIARFPE